MSRDARGFEPGAARDAQTVSDERRDPQTKIGVALVRLPPRDELEREWRSLEERSDGSFFVGWSWIGCWIESLEDAVELRLLRASLDGRTVGLGVLATCRERRHGFIISRTLRLNATGRPQFDVLCVECNGFLAERALGESIGACMYAHLVREDRSWDELVLDGLWRTPSWPLSAGQARRRVQDSANHYINLADVRARSGDYLGLLGSKTRSRIRRSVKEYEKFGQLALQCAADATQALAFLDGLKALHQSYWVARGQPGAFASRFFDSFHRRLVRDAFGRGEIQLLAIDAGARRLGYIYNFVYRDRVYNYQSGFDYELCEKHNRPGLVAHAHAIEFNAGCGHSVYDFLAGDVEYKQALGTDVASMSWMIVQRDRLRFRLEDAARALRRRLRRNQTPPKA